ncbi:membrane protein [soil metagenome]
MIRRFCPVGQGIRVAIWLAAIGILALSVVRGRDLQRRVPDVFLGAAPLVGRKYWDGWDWRFGWGLVGAVIIGGLVVLATLRDWWQTASRTLVHAVTGVCAAAFAVSLALTDGFDGIRYGAAHRTEYAAHITTTPPVAEFVRTFIERIDGYSVHIRGHPPGFMVLLKAIAALGFGGVGPAVVLSIVATGLLPVAVLVAVRTVADDGTMRRAAPFLVVAPYALWMITSADAVYTALGAAAVAAVAVGAGRRGRTAALFGLVAGLLLGALMFGTYLAGVFMAVPGIVGLWAWWRRLPGALPVAVSTVIGLVVVVGLFRWAGFWWLDGVRRTNEEYWDGSAQYRVWTYFAYANVAAALIALGPATLAGLTRPRRWRAWPLVGVGVLAVAVSNASGFTRGEVERIWLLFYPWIAVAGAALLVPSTSTTRSAATTHRRGATWVAAQAAGAIVLQSVLVSKW